MTLSFFRGCPQCRVKSAFYVPHNYWVEGPAKETLIASFKEKCRSDFLFI